MTDISKQPSHVVLLHGMNEHLVKSTHLMYEKVGAKLSGLMNDAASLGWTYLEKLLPDFPEFFRPEVESRIMKLKKEAKEKCVPLLIELNSVRMYDLIKDLEKSGVIVGAVRCKNLSLEPCVFGHKERAVLTQKSYENIQESFIANLHTAICKSVDTLRANNSNLCNTEWEVVLKIRNVQYDENREALEAVFHVGLYPPGAGKEHCERYVRSNPENAVISSVKGMSKPAVLAIRYLDILKDLGVEEKRNEEGSVELSHIMWMLKEIKTNSAMSNTKKHRWIGFIQGILAANKIIEIVNERNITREVLGGE